MKKRSLMSAVGALCAAFSMQTASAADPFELHVILTLTGSASFIGQGSRQTLQVLEKIVNEEGGIQGRPLKFVFHDDRTNPQTSVQIANEIIDSGAQVILGSGISAMCSAVAPLLREGPFQYCFSPGVVPKPGSYQFSANASVREAFPSVLNYIKGKGYTRVGVIFSTDTTGQDAEHGLAAAMKDPAYKDLQIVATEHFAPGDISVTAQVEKIRSANPQILIAWTSGAPAGTVLRSVSQSAMGVPVIIGQANLSERAMSQFAEILPREMLIPGGTGAVRGDIAGVDARVNQAREAYFAKMDAAGVAVENSGENAWDAANVVIETLRKFGPGVKAADILKHISGIQERVGISGVYDFTKYPQRGLSGVELVMSRWNPQTKRFEAVSGRGGVVAQ